MASKSSQGTSALASPFRLGAITLASVVLASCGGGGGDKMTFEVGTPIQIRTLSNRADLVSDGNVLTEIDLTPGLAKQPLKVTLNGADITSAFTRNGDRYVGLVTGLQVGDNTLVADVDPGKSGGLPAAKLLITNHPRSGPIYSGPAHLTPFICATPTAVAPTATSAGSNASGLSGQADANCTIPAETTLYYRTTTASTGAGACSTALPSATPPLNSCWQIYTPGSTPANMATTTTDNGQTVPFIVRVERGTMNRGIYDLVVLFDPTKPWTAVAPQPQWNGKVYYGFGSSTGQPRRQSRTTYDAWSTHEEQLKRGWMVTSNSMTDSVRNSNRVLMTETVMMMKEHIGDTYGRIKFTMGTGCSGGSINSNMNLSIFPTLLDGVVTSCTYPDSETTTLEVGDCSLLVEAYQKPAMLNLWSGMSLTQTDINVRKGHINGHPDHTGCQAWLNLFGNNGRAGVYAPRTVTNHTTGAISSGALTNNCELPNSQVYDPARPTETASLPRCNAWSWAENIWGKVPGSPAARDTRDNVGVQYGLGALLAGRITAEEFVTLNEVIGGIDRDSTPRAQRSTADVEALDIAYRAGIVASGKNLAKAPIIDLRGWDDSLVLPPGVNFATGIHRQWFTWAVRDRITRDAGDANNQAIWRWYQGNFATPPGTLKQEAFVSMDKWLTDFVADSSGRSLEARARATRPAETRDFCLTTADSTVAGRTYDMAVCDQHPILKPTASPRQVAGGPRSEDVLKCQLKPLNQADYGTVSFSSGQWARMQAVFSTGVCDWSRPGVGQQEAVSPLNFKTAPGQGVPMGPAPTSSRV